MKGFKQFVFELVSSLPDNDFSVEQAHVSIGDLLSGNYAPSKSNFDYADCEDDTDDDYDDACRDSWNLDNEFEQSIHEKKVMNDNKDTEDETD